MFFFNKEAKNFLTEKPRIPLKEIILLGLLPSPIKILIYKLMGYRIGKAVCLGIGSVIIGNDVEIGEHTNIGFFTILRGEKIRLGAHVRIGATSFIDTPRIYIGDGTKINEQVFIGGLQFPDSCISIGRNCQIMQMSFINPARSITIGDDTGIGGHSLIFGHTSWLSVFEGYPVEFDSIEIGNSVSLAWRVFVLPGTKIGDGAVIGANSLVHRTIPERCMAVGFPARVVSKYPDFPKALRDEDKVEILRNVVEEMIPYLGGAFGIDFRPQSSDRYHLGVKNGNQRSSRTEEGVLQIIYSPDQYEENFNIRHCGSHRSDDVFDMVIISHRRGGLGHTVAFVYGQTGPGFPLVDDIGGHAGRS